MATIFEGDKADDRQSEDTKLAPSLFRKRYRQLAPADVVLHDAIKDKADELARLFEQVNAQLAKQDRPQGLIDGLNANQGANVTIALRHLEDAVYRAVKALTA